MLRESVELGRQGWVAMAMGGAQRDGAGRGATGAEAAPLYMRYSPSQLFSTFQVIVCN